MFFGILLIGAYSWSLSIYDPNDQIYRCPYAWEEKGYFDTLPMLMLILQRNPLSLVGVVHA
jgi:hypothetical protein